MIPQPFHHKYENFQISKDVKDSIFETDEDDEVGNKKNNLKKSQRLNDLWSASFVFGFWIKTV